MPSSTPPTTRCCAPFLTLLSRAPSVGAITLLAAFLVMGANLLVQLITLPVEWDASFNKALPLLKAGYLSPAQQRGAERILRAAALTYLSASLAAGLEALISLRTISAVPCFLGIPTCMRQ